MSKQYLQTHCIAQAHKADIFALAATPTQIISGSGSSDLHIHNITFSPDDNVPYPLTQTLSDAHKLGTHHICVSRNGSTFTSVGFGGDVKLWTRQADEWVAKGRIVDDLKAGEIWAVALSDDGKYLAGTTFDGRVNVWDTDLLTSSSSATSTSTKETTTSARIQAYESKGSFGTCVDLSSDGELTASGHANGSVHIFNNSTGRLAHSLQGLIKPIRTVSFSPACRYIAAGGDAKVIALYDVKSGEQVANLTCAGWIMGLDWNHSGEYLLSGGHDGRAKVWSIDRRECVATQTESDAALWAVKWIPKSAAQRNETFVTAGASRSISFYREATGM